MLPFVVEFIIIFALIKNFDLIEKFKQEMEASNQLKMQYSNLNRV